MSYATVHAAKTNLSQLLARVEAGEEIILSRGKQPIAKLVPFVPPKSKRQYGSMRGLIKLDESFFDPLPEEEPARWE